MIGKWGLKCRISALGCPYALSVENWTTIKYGIFRMWPEERYQQ